MNVLCKVRQITHDDFKDRAGLGVDYIIGSRLMNNCRCTKKDGQHGTTVALWEGAAQRYDVSMRKSHLMDQRGVAQRGMRVAHSPSHLWNWSL